MSTLPGRHAVVIGIDAYSQGIAPLKSAVADARAIAETLSSDHGYQVPGALLDSEATGTRILGLLEEDLPRRIRPDSALVLYFAGHGIARGDGSEGPEGFLMPQDAHPADDTTWLPMDRVKKALGRLPCRHLLVVLDCCFAGSFRWASTRNFVPVGRPLFDSQYNRYLLGTAWQVLTSASHDEKALDVVPGVHNNRDDDGAEGHSPFAAALLQGLAGDADSSRGSHSADGVMTVTELYQYIFEELVPPGSPSRQTPGLWPLKPENTGEFIFLSPRQEKQTRPDPPLDDAHNPWLGLAAYDEDDASLFFGRERVVSELAERLLDEERPPLLAVVGASGIGKSSVVKAGLVPLLRQRPLGGIEGGLQQSSPAWTVVNAPRLQGDPRSQLAEAERQLAEAPAGHRKLLVLDQFEEVFTQCPDVAARDGFFERLRQLMIGETWVVLTLRSDFEPRLKASEALKDLYAAGRYLVPVLDLDELRDVIEKPATLKALYFEPDDLVDDLVDEVMAMPGALPLLSFALAETYRQAQLRRRETGALDRALTRRDYEAAGGVVGSLHRRASELYDGADGARRETVRRLFLRMVSQQGGRLARRRVEERELAYADPEERTRLEEVLADYVGARLLVSHEGYVEPAHDTLVLAWEKLLSWLERYGSQGLQRQLWQAAAAWDEAREKSSRKARGLLWNQDPRLPQVRRMRGERNALEGEFVEASVRRKRRRRSVYAAILTVVLVLFAGAAFYSNSKRLQAGEALERTQRVTTFLTELLETTDPFDTSNPGSKQGTSITVRELLDRGLEKLRPAFEDDPRTRAQLLGTLGGIYRNLGHLEEAEPLLREALEMRRRLLGDEHPDIATSLNNLALLLDAKGDYEGAEPLYREDLEMSRRLLGDEHPDVAISLNNLASLLHDKGDYEGAEPLYREDLEMSRRLLGDEHPDIAITLNNLALLLHDRGDYEAAEPLYREALEMKRRLVGDEHPHIAISLNNLGLLLRNRGDYEGAEPLFREALEMRRRLLGDEHPQVATSLHNLASLLHDRGNYEAAEPLFHEALEMSRRLLGDEHPDVAISLSAIAWLLLALDRPAEAEAAIREALEIFRQALPPDHWRIKNAESVVGAVLAALGRYEEAEPLLVASYPAVRDVKGDSSPYTRHVLERLAALYDAWGRPGKAAEYRALWAEAGGSQEIFRALGEIDDDPVRFGAGTPLPE